MMSPFASDCQWCGAQRITKRDILICMHCDFSCLGPNVCDVCRKVQDNKRDGRGPHSRFGDAR